MKLPILDLIVFVVLTFGNVILGACFFFRNKRSDQFASWSGGLPAWVVGMSIFTTFVSSISFLAQSGKDYLSNWNTVAFSLFISLALLDAFKLIIPRDLGLSEISACNCPEFDLVRGLRLMSPQ
jgi:SSS family solute:Na+ symporter